MTNYKAVLFDLDDTLVDAHRHILDAFNYSLRSEGIKEIGDKELAGVAGVPLHKCYEKFGVHEAVEKLVNHHRQFQVENMHLVKKYAGTDETLIELRKAGIKTAVVTSRYRNTTELIIAKTGLDKLVDAVIAGDDFPQAKPHPRPFLEAARRVGAQASECLAVGDGCADIVAGKAAGMKTCRALYGYGASQACAAKADFEANSIKEVLDIVNFGYATP